MSPERSYAPGEWFDAYGRQLRTDAETSVGDCHMKGSVSCSVTGVRGGDAFRSSLLPGRVLDFVAEVRAAVSLDVLDLFQAGLLGDTRRGWIARPDQAYESW